MQATGAMEITDMDSTTRTRRKQVPNFGSIAADEIMPAAEFRRRFGMGKKAWAALTAAGFPTIPCGRQKLVDGGAALAFFRGGRAAMDSGSTGTEGRTP